MVYGWTRRTVPAIERGSCQTDNGHFKVTSSFFPFPTEEDLNTQNNQTTSLTREMTIHVLTSTSFLLSLRRLISLGTKKGLERHERTIVHSPGLVSFFFISVQEQLDNRVTLLPFGQTSGTANLHTLCANTVIFFLDCYFQNRLVLSISSIWRYWTW